jgi:hypothetical protein
MMAQIIELQSSSAKVSQPADITDDPIVAPASDIVQAICSF